MKCVRCGGETVQDQWGDWCDDCGGVAASLDKMMFRHVATVNGAGGRFAVVYDSSTADYGVMWPREDSMVICIHCGQQTPSEVRSGLMQLDGMKPSKYYSKRGSLDAMLAFIQPIARRGSEELPELSVAPTATKQERELVLG